MRSVNVFNYLYTEPNEQYSGQNHHNKVGIWGKRHLKYIKHRRPILYTNLLTSMLWGAGLRWRPLPQAEAPTEPTGETANEQYSQPCNGDCKYRVDLFLISTAAKWDNLLLGGVFKKRAENLLTKQKSNDIIPIIICRQNSLGKCERRTNMIVSEVYSARYIPAN